MVSLNLRPDRQPTQRPTGTLQPMPRQRPSQSGATNQPGPNGPQHSSSGPAPDSRHFVADRLVRDCYSKNIPVNGRTVTETKYITHMAIYEYSQHPQAPPPASLPEPQWGPVKERVLVVGMRHTGHTVLQKGKLNEAKGIYQIGRTWELEELRQIRRTGADSFVLALNKDYYWRCSEGPDRLIRFIHHLVVTHHRVRGTYPELNGFLLESLGVKPQGLLSSLSGLQLSLPQSQSQAQSQPSAQPQAQPLAQPQSQAQKPNDIYKNMDFTVNGKLPFKAMQVMDVDRNAPQPSPGPSPQKANTVHQASDKNSHQASDKAVRQSLSEYARATGSALPLRKYRPQKTPDPQVPSESLEAAANYGRELQLKLDPEFDRSKFTAAAAAAGTRTSAASLEEVEDFSDDEADSRPRSMPRLGTAPLAKVPEAPTAILPKVRQSPKKLVQAPPEKSASRPEATNRVSGSAMDESIQEIEQFIDAQFSEGLNASVSLRSARRKSQPSVTEGSPRPKAMERVPEIVEESAKGTPTPASTDLQKDPEIDELLDEIGWDVTKPSDKCVRLLQKELASIKHKNIVELTTLDFGKDSLANEISLASAETENLIDIFRRMEVEFAMVAPQINSIEANSKGLHVEAVNKKILYNSLNEILQKVRLSGRDLHDVADYNDFGDVAMVPLLESKLLVLYDALGAIGAKDARENLGQMSALAQFQQKYSAVAEAFAHRFLDFAEVQLEGIVDSFTSQVDVIQPYGMLVELRKLYPYVGVTNFIKSASPTAFVEFKDRFVALMEKFADKLLTLRIAGMGSTQRRGSRSFVPEEGHRRSKSRFGSTRILNRFSTGQELKPDNKPPADNGKRDEITDPNVVLRITKESKEFMLAVQYFFGHFFHALNQLSYAEYVSQTPFEERIRFLEAEDVDSVHYQSNANELLTGMNGIFGNYINRFVKELIPGALTIPAFIVALQEMVKDASRGYQDFVCYRFLTNLIDKLHQSWIKYVTQRSNLLDKTDTRTAHGVSPAISDLKLVITALEQALNGRAVSPDYTEIMEMTYSQLTRSAVTLFERKDPLLKSNSHDDKERAQRNITMLQNIFSLMEHLEQYRGEPARRMSQSLDDVFQQIEQRYFEYLTGRTYSKVSDFIKENRARDGKWKKEDKAVLQGIINASTSREVSRHAVEMRRKMEKQLGTESILQHDLFERLWRNLGKQMELMFQELAEIVRTVDKDADIVSPMELRNIFMV